MGRGVLILLVTLRGEPLPEIDAVTAAVLGVNFPARCDVPLTRGRRLAVAALLAAAFAHPLAAQIPGLGGQGAPDEPPQPAVVDPFGRTTPRGTITGFMRAMGREDLVSAARYLQLTPSQQDHAGMLAGALEALIDRHFSGTVAGISDAPEGALDDGQAQDLERIGPLSIGETGAYVALVRTADSLAGQVWLVSTETLARVPEWHAAVGRTWIERVMPRALVARRVFGLSLAHWLVLAASLLVPLVALAFLAAAGVRLARLVVRGPASRLVLDAWYRGLLWPGVTVAALVVHLLALLRLGIPITSRIVWGRLAVVALVLALAWLLRRLLALGFGRARDLAWGPDGTSAQSLLLLGERMLKAVVVLLALFAILTIVGVDTRTALAGLGIGGVALALGAQKTVENLLGGVFLLTDRALAVGDLCRIAGRVGRVEDITLRSVRIRTLDQTLVSVPAGVLAQAGIENFATREKILIHTTLRLRHGTDVGQLRAVLRGVRELLARHPRLEPGTARVRLVDFGERAVELELFTYVLTADDQEGMAVREELLLGVAGVVEASGSAFALPPEVASGGAPAARP